MKPVDGRHLRDDQMIAVCIGADTVSDPEDVLTHLETCAACSGRYDDVARDIESLKDAANAEADAHFTHARLEAQRQQIMARLEHIGHHARVIQFPLHAERRLAIFTGAQLRHWTVAAAAAGVLLGVGVGRLVDFRPAQSTHTKQAISAQAPETPRPAYLRPPGEPTPMVKPNDEEILSRTLYQQQVGDLDDLDAMTPHVVAAMASRR